MRLRLLLAGAALPLLLWALSPALSQAGPSASQIQKKIQVTQGKIGRKKGTERVLSSDIAAYSHRIGRLQDRIGSLQARESRIQADLDAKQARLSRTQADLRAERARIVRLRNRLKEARTLLARRLVELYEADRPDLMTVVLNAKGFADLLERGAFLKRINDQDRAVVLLVRNARADANAAEKRLSKLEATQARITAIVRSHRDELARIKQGLIDTRVGYANTKAGKQRALSKVRGERQHLEGALSHLKAEQAKITAALQGAGTLPAGAIRRGSGSMIWPVNGPITSPFCERRAWEACHPGIDIGVPTGTPIRAAAAGRVALMQSVGESGGYGNYTCIQHTASLSTCYAHQSRFATSVGAHVRQGQVIGYSGCTGLCFGPHLHFEVRINGVVTNPLNYL
jgi:murein DD-endopeptidase MepM/ murein hydrolase activator NlpD